MMGVNTIIGILVGFIALLAVVAFAIDNWNKPDDDMDDFEPYG
jgi:hypothetical protein